MRRAVLLGSLLAACGPCGFQPDPGVKVVVPAMPSTLDWSTSDPTSWVNYPVLLAIKRKTAAGHVMTIGGLATELGLGGLSMGMSADFETAVAFGATHVRVGSEIFGPRAPAPSFR